MQVHIIDVSGKRVHFKTNIGDAYGLWKDETPVPGRKYSVEFDFSGEVSPQCLRHASEKDYHIRMDGDIIELTGQVLEWDDSCLTILLDDSIVLFETTGMETDTYRPGEFVTVRLDHISLYDEKIY